MTEPAPKQENPLIGLMFNIILPVAILNQGTKRLGPEYALPALALALALPIGYGLYDYFTNHKKNYVSLLGIINVGITGGLAMMQLEGFWFAVKEAFFPFIIGVAIAISGLMRKPFLKSVLWNPQVFDTEKIETTLAAQNRSESLPLLFLRANWVFAGSFFISSFLNFVLAVRIFAKIPDNVDQVTRQAMLNEQIAQMTWKGYVVIAFPLMFLMMGLIWYVVREIRRESGLTFEEIFKESRPSA